MKMQEKETKHCAARNKNLRNMDGWLVAAKGAEGKKKVNASEQNLNGWSNVPLRPELSLVPSVWGA